MGTVETAIVLLVGLLLVLTLARITAWASEPAPTPEPPALGGHPSFHYPV